MLQPIVCLPDRTYYTGDPIDEPRTISPNIC